MVFARMHLGHVQWWVASIKYSCESDRATNDLYGRFHASHKKHIGNVKKETLHICLYSNGTL